jgi:hypothetical protein
MHRPKWHSAREKGQPGRKQQVVCTGHMQISGVSQYDTKGKFENDDGVKSPLGAHCSAVGGTQSPASVCTHCDEPCRCASRVKNRSASQMHNAQRTTHNAQRTTHNATKTKNKSKLNEHYPR